MLFCVTIDTEEEWDWEAGFPVKEHGVRNILKLSRFHDLCQKYNVATTYFTNDAVAADDAAAGVIEDFRKTASTEIGMHLHPWLTQPCEPSHNSTRFSFLENLPAEVGRQKLETVYQRHLSRGWRPTSFRGGRYSSGPVTQNFLWDHRFRVDASVCPFSTWEDSGSPDYRDHDGRPHPIINAAKKRGRSEPNADNNQQDACTLWSLPLTRVYSRRPMAVWNQRFQTIEGSSLRKLRLIGILERLGIAKRIWLNFETEQAESMLWVVRNAAKLQLPYLCFTVHSSSLSRGPSPYAKTDAHVERIFTGIESVFQLLSEMDTYRPATVTQIAEALDQKL